MNNFMIFAVMPDVNRNFPFDQERYDEFVVSISLSQISCPYEECGHVGFYRHGSYLRKPVSSLVEGSEGKHIETSDDMIRLIRVRCPECNHTHTIMPEFIIPYLHLSVDVMIMIVDEEKMKGREKLKALMDQLDLVDLQAIYRVKAFYRKFCRSVMKDHELPGLSDPELSEKCIRAVKRQFMQSHQGLCYVLSDLLL